MTPLLCLSTMMEEFGLCEEHGIRILYYSNAHIEYPYPVFESLRLLLKAIKDKSVVADSRKWKDLQLTLDFEE